MVMPPRQTLHDIPRHIPKPQHLAAFRLHMRIRGFAAGEGGEVGFVHGAAGFGAEDVEGFLRIHPGFGGVVGNPDGADVGGFVGFVEEHHVIDEAEHVCGGVEAAGGLIVEDDLGCPLGGAVGVHAAHGAARGALDVLRREIGGRCSCGHCHQQPAG